GGGVTRRVGGVLVRDVTGGGDRWRATPIRRRRGCGVTPGSRGVASIGEVGRGCTGEGAERCPTPEEAQGAALRPDVPRRA
ncbi:uncharacterized protein SCHCODRAFT_02724324, partial [Schizophyllum commune H4-8]|uniref:uncharacterized protein n=1 Tax=Schizophyllum commune (strain H4-8 / FGSC 9210) TaxID=578458 RepID=UPI00215E7D93